VLQVVAGLFELRLTDRTAVGFRSRHGPETEEYGIDACSTILGNEHSKVALTPSATPSH
jgi:hypothetical protein